MRVMITPSEVAHMQRRGQVRAAQLPWEGMRGEGREMHGSQGGQRGVEERREKAREVREATCR